MSGDELEKPKLGFWDTEWSPAISYTWSGFPKYLPNDFLIEDPRLLCWGFKFDGDSETEVVDERIGHEEMTRQLWERLDRVDILVSYNGQSFDTRKVNSEFMRYGMGPPSPYKEVDLYRQIKRAAQFYSGKLDFVAERIIGQKKVDTGGFQLWKDVLANDEEAWGKFRKYQKQDVDLLEQLFDEVSPWIKLPHPLVHSDHERCTNSKCPEDTLGPRGKALTLNGEYQRYHCYKSRGGCGRWLRGQTRISSSIMRNIA